MARISGVDLPRNKRIDIGLTYVFGIGTTSANQIVTAAKVLPSTRCNDLTDEEITRIVDESRPEETVAICNTRNENVGEKGKHERAEDCQASQQLAIGEQAFALSGKCRAQRCRQNGAQGHGRKEEAPAFETKLLEQQHGETYRTDDLGGGSDLLPVDDREADRRNEGRDRQASCATNR